jgi:DNA polymerase III epsilon subunit-like protein
MGMNFDGISGNEKGKSYSLKTLTQRFNIPLNHHYAESDRKACQKLFELFYSKGARDHLVYPLHEEKSESL